MGVGGQRHVLVALTWGKTQYPLYRRMGESQEPVWTGAENLAHPPGFDPRTIHYNSVFEENPRFIKT